MNTRFEIGQNIYVLYKEAGAFPRYEVKGTQIVGVKQELDFGKVVAEKTLETRYRLLVLPDRWLTDELLYSDFKEAKLVCDKLNGVDKAIKAAQPAKNIKHG